MLFEREFECRPCYSLGAEFLADVSEPLHFLN
jgi:hypothetical protein